MGKIRATGAFTVGFAPDSIPTATPTNCGVWNATTNYVRDQFVAPYVKHEGAYYLRISDGNCIGINPKTDVASQSRYWQHNEIIDLFCARKIQADEIDVDTITLGNIFNGTGMLIGKDAYKGKMGVFAMRNGDISFWLSADGDDIIINGAEVLGSVSSNADGNRIVISASDRDLKMIDANGNITTRLSFMTDSVGTFPSLRMYNYGTDGNYYGSSYITPTGINMTNTGIDGKSYYMRIETIGGGKGFSIRGDFPTFATATSGQMYKEDIGADGFYQLRIKK